jgi:hypothetical protein
MSGRSYDSYSRSIGSTHRAYRSGDEAERRRAEEERAERVAEARKRIDEGRVGPREVRRHEEVYDPSLARNAITTPAADAKRVHVVLIDNSGSNRRIADHLKQSSGYLLAALGAIDPESQVAFVYFSDHCDGPLVAQEVDYVSPDAKGDKVLHSSIAHVRPAGGGDEPEAIECALWDACDLDFGHVQERHLYLVTDVVAHGMGLRGDDGCPKGRSWKEAIDRIRTTYRSFEVIGCGSDPHAAKLQEKFVAPERLSLDLIDLSAIPTHEHRCGITGNALLFLVARHRGLQNVEAFLMTLYEKWLAEPIFGANTDLGAREAIARFTKYLDAPQAKVRSMLDKIFV